jgi:ABC-type transporter Mla subunit MlaD
MSGARTGLRVGMFAVAGIFAVLALVFFLSGSALHPGLPYETYFQESVEGLDVGTAVKFRGVTIGKVTDVGLVAAEYPPDDPDNGLRKVYQQVVVRFRVDPKKIGRVTDVDAAIAHGLRAQIEPQGITGLSYIDLSFVNPSQYPAPGTVPWTPDSTVIPSVPSTLTQVQDALEQALSSMSKVNLGKMFNQAEDLLSLLDQQLTNGDARQAVANANRLLANLNTQLQRADLPGTTATVRNLAGGPETTQILAQLNKTTAQLSKVSGELPALVAQSQATIDQADETTADLQAQLGPILQDMKTATANLRELTETLKRNPSEVLLGAAPPPDGGN